MAKIAEKITLMPNGSLSESPKDNFRPRETWARQTEFILSVVGFSVGLGNVWRFPYLCYKNGGGAFLVPYLIFLFAGGIPVFFLEVALGQFMAQGGISAWNICPIFKGIGYGTIIIEFLLNIYYIVILAWALFQPGFIYKCILLESNYKTNYMCLDSCVEFNLQTKYNATNETSVDPVVEFWERKILKITNGVDDLGGMRWELFGTLIAVWVGCYFCIWKGIKSTGKVVYFTTTFPYLMITALLIRGVTLDGAYDGIVYYLYPDFSRLIDSQVWIDAGTQIFFSYAVALGGMTALGSYNNFNNNCYRDVYCLAAVNSCTSFYSGFAIFSVLGFMAKQQDVPIDQVAAPEGLITSVVDLFPRYLRKGHRREWFIAAVSFVTFLFGIPLVMEGGMYWFQIFDYYSASGVTLLWFCFFESISIGWIYGADRFYDDIEKMVGYRINPWMKICWKYITPLICGGIFVFSLLNFHKLTYNKTYIYPAWAVGFGWLLALMSMICIPVYIIIQLSRLPGTFKERITKLITPIYTNPLVIEELQNSTKNNRNNGQSDDPSLVLLTEVSLNT
uniref:Transporter n=1 Tax=Strigamia maritima TaxID=126957 RepID=T1J4F1_STRMM